MAAPRAAAALLALCGRGGALRLPKVLTSNMVVPAERPVWWGWASAAGATVTVRASTGESASAAAGDGGAFRVELPPRAASMTPFSVTVDEGGANATTLGNLLAGDVWVCSGQSNMEFSVAEMFDSAAVIRDAGHDGLRLFAVQKNASGAPIDDLQDTQYREGWVEASTQNVCGSEYGARAEFCEPHCGPSASVKSFARNTWGYFSAVCFVHGVELLKATGRPQGLLETCWGGTAIERWSSADALAQCAGGDSGPADDEPEPPIPLSAGGAASGGGGLWNGMVAPLLPLPIRGAVWYQGEANKNKGNKYACQLRAMVEDWRKGFAALPGAAAPFTFVTVQIAPAGGGGELRLAQAASTALPNAGLAVTIDLYDQHSPCGAVHIRNKTAVGRRTARAARALAYGEGVAWTGPLPAAIAAQGGEVTVRFTGAAGALAFAAVPNQTTAPGESSFEVTGDAGLLSGWRPAPARVSGASVIVGAANGSAVAGVRYAWAGTPRGELLYDSGAGLPAGPFLANCSSGACALVKGGDVPTGKPGPAPPAPPQPAPPAPPQPPVPQSGNCTFQNETTYLDESYKKVNVDLNDYAACCALCHADTKCAVAQMHHGMKTATYDFCYLMATAEKPSKATVVPPALELACIPKRG